MLFITAIYKVMAVLTLMLSPISVLLSNMSDELISLESMTVRLDISTILNIEFSRKILQESRRRASAKGSTVFDEVKT